MHSGPSRKGLPVCSWDLLSILCFFFFREVNCFYFRRCPLNELCSYTRTCPLLLTLIASDLDPVAGKEMLGKNIRWFGAWGKTLELEIVLEKTSAFQDLILPLIPAIKGLFEIPCYLSVHNDMDIISFEAIQLSTQGSERQRKDVVCYTYS